MGLSAAELSGILEERITKYYADVNVDETGKVLSIGDGVARVYGLNKIKAGGNSQKEILLSLGKAISGAPIINGTNQFPNPPIITGITRKKIITKA